MRTLASSHCSRPSLPGASKSAQSQRAVAPKAAPDGKAKAAGAGVADDVDGAPSSSDATSPAQRRALAAAGLAASLIMVRRHDR